MARGSSQATDAAGSAQGFSNQLQGNAQGLYSTLAPQLAAEAAHPQGYAPSDLAKMNTAAQESAGGTAAAAQGEGALRASRTRNAGTADAAIAESAKVSGRDLSSRALQIQGKNADLKEHQRQSALAEEGGLYGTSVGGGNAALGQVANNVDANTKAAEQSWDWAKYILDPAMQGAAEVGKGLLAGGGGCWIAEAIYGVDDQRTHLVRAWLNGPFKKTWIGGIVMAVYMRIGRRVARAVRSSRILKACLKPLFDKALDKAMA